MSKPTPIAAGSPGWVVLVPVKGTAIAKSRLGGDPAYRTRLATAIALDTVSAVLQTDSVLHTVVVTSATAAAPFRELGAQVVVQSAAPHVTPDATSAAGGPLNAAIRQGLSVIDADPRFSTSGVAILLGDVPGLRPSELSTALALASEHPRAMVPDAETSGTVLLCAQPPETHVPLFGGDSARAHREAGYTPLEFPEHSGLRRDVDTREQLQAVTRDGIGAFTREAMAAADGQEL